MDKLKLKPCHALDVELSFKAYTSEEVQNFIRFYDLSSCSGLSKRCKDYCEWYEEVMLNGKYFLSSYIEETLRNSDKEHLVIILSADFLPLSIEILLKNSDKVNRILEIDTYGMDVKQELYDKTFPGFSSKIKCITADLSSQTVLNVVHDLLNDYYTEYPCLVVLNNPALYFDPAELESIVRSFRSGNNHNKFIIEYLLPPEEIAEERKEIPQKIFNMICEESGTGRLFSYSRKNIESIFERQGASLMELNDLSLLEKKRKGENKYFIKPSDGWLEYAVFRI